MRRVWRRSDRRRLSLVGLLLLLTACLPACSRRPGRDEKAGDAKSGQRHVATLNLRGGVTESTSGGGIFPLPVSDTYVSLVRQLQRLKKDASVRGVFVKLGSGLGFHRAEELGTLLQDFGATKRPVVCHAHELDNAGLWLALAGCSEIWVSAAGDVNAVGIGAEMSYLKSAFDKLGIQADMLAMGRYKSGGEALTREGPSEASLQNLQATLTHLRTLWLEGLARGQADPETLKRLAEDGPWTPERARELGLITDVGFEDEALRAAQKASGVRRTKAIFGPGSGGKAQSPLAEIVRTLAGAGDAHVGRPRIVVLPAIGAITMEGGGGLGSDSGISAASMTRTIKRLRDDADVKAIVLRLDSPGGSPLASDLIWRELMLTRPKKPIIVSIGSMAASGGYYIACAGTKIVSSPTAIVGSIGVFGGKIVLRGALEKFGVGHYAVAASPAPGAAARALHLSPLEPWDDATRERVRGSMKRIYDLFVARVAEGRAMEADAVYQTAEGAIFLAPTGKDRGLIDELGGVGAALELARREAGLGADVPIVVEGAAESIMETLLLGPGAEAEEVQAALVAYERRQLTLGLSYAEPGLLETLRPLAASVAPLLAGEPVVAALPFSLTFH